MSRSITIPLSASGVSAAALLTRGRWEMLLVADSFDGTKPIAVQWAPRIDTEARYQTVEDPETGAAMARTAAGRSWVHECSRGYVRLSVPDLGTTTNLRLECNWIGV